MKDIDFEPAVQVVWIFLTIAAFALIFALISGCIVSESIQRITP